jgi:hypothetical protein
MSLVLGAFLCAPANAADDAGKKAKSKEARTLELPGQSIGILRIRDAGSTGTSGWGEPFEAEGTVKVPAGKEVLLRISEEAFEKGALDDVLRLGPDAIDVLSVRRLHRFGDDHLERLKNWNLSGLILAGTGITNDGLAHIADMKSLALLDLTRTRIGDDGLEHLKELKNMTWLDLAWLGRSVTGWPTAAGLAHLKGMKNLRVLSLNHIAHDEMVEVVSEIPSIERLSLGSARLTTAGLTALTKMPNLEWLSLRAIRRPSRLPGIYHRVLPEVLPQIEKLEYVDLRGLVMPEHYRKKLYKELRRKMPDTEIRTFDNWTE